MQEGSRLREGAQPSSSHRLFRGRLFGLVLKSPNLYTYLLIHVSAYPSISAAIWPRHHMYLSK
ncbi:hypothetical protein E2C01_023122 [Portunus trituberculatus]|uniref:Uncharacterized protein n=1 Tax=Portunus trituberculatus TaxID=210409 RepID=A0A5B7E763_PORTR|nr:hypothetical protein [Portunus trituberculatus]